MVIGVHKLSKVLLALPNEQPKNFVSFVSYSSLEWKLHSQRTKNHLCLNSNKSQFFVHNFGQNTKFEDAYVLNDLLPSVLTDRAEIAENDVILLSHLKNCLETKAF